MIHDLESPAALWVTWDDASAYGGFRALARALATGARGGPVVGPRLAALPRMVRATLRGEYDGGRGWP